MKNKILEKITIEKLWYGWIWISTLPSWVKVLVSWWILPWSVVDCRVIKNKKDYFECQVVKVHSLWDVELKDDLCPHYFFYEKWWCGWCKWQILPYEKQVDLKHKIVYDSLRNIKNVVDKIWLKEVLHSPEFFWYRNKVEFTFGHDYKKSIPWMLWFNKQWDFLTVVDVADCKLISGDQNDLYRYLKNIFINSGLPIYNKKTHIGFYRHLVMRKWVNTNQMLINLVVSNQYLLNNIVAAKQFESLKETLSKDEYLSKTITTFVITYNNWLADIVKWQDIKTDLLWWDWYIYENLKFTQLDWEGKEVDLKFRVSPFSFFQTNTLWAQVLFSQWAKVAWEVKWTILDLYCGAWSIWLSFLKMWLWKDVIWIEIVEEAIEDAKYNAKINGLDSNSYFVAWKAEKLIFEDQKIKDNIENINLVVIDPPRDWLHKNVVKFLWDLKQIKNYKLLYISCNPVTMSRDIQLLLELWFELNYLQPVDMFPHTHHIEMIWLLN